MYRLKPGLAGTRVVKGSQTITLTEDMSQQYLWHLHVMHPGLTEEYDEVQEYIEAKPKKKKDVEDNKKLD